MNDLNLKTEMGKYEIILRDVPNYVIINVIERYKIGLVEEAIDYALKYNAKNTYLSLPFEISEYKEYSKVLRYDLEHYISKSYKEIKMNQIELSNRDMVSKILNSRDKSFLYKSVDNFDVMDIVREKGSYYFSYKHNIIGLISFDGNIIKNLAFLPGIENEIMHMALSKAIYFAGKDLTIYLSSLDNKMIDLVRMLGFRLKEVERTIYEV